MNDLPTGLQSDCKMLADDTSLFSIIKDPKVTAAELNSDLAKISRWAFQWKMSFNPDPTKQAQEVSWKVVTADHFNVFFNDSVVQRTSVQRHLGLYLDEKFSFHHHLKEKLAIANKGIGIIIFLLAIYKSFIRPHLDYGDVIYDQPNNISLCKKIESIQYNAALPITGAIRGTSKERMYQELGFEYLSCSDCNYLLIRVLDIYLI